MKEFFDTIAAISTPPGSGGISIIKISGNEAVSLASRVFKVKKGGFPDIKTHHFYYGHATDPVDQKIIDECLLLYMKSPKSYTGEDVIEFHCHGGPICSGRLLQTLLSQGARMANPGEFTLRAFLNGKKDLTQAEAVETVVHSKTFTQQENALLQLAGGLRLKLEVLVSTIREEALELDASINFPGDVDGKENSCIIQDFKALQSVLTDLEASFFDGKPFFEGIYSVIIGKPNVGKSSFLNKILEYERAIVSTHPGTTRDFIEEGIIFEGFPLKIVDTAGIRESADPVEAMGVERAISLLPKASAIFVIFDISEPPDDNDKKIIALISAHKDAAVFALLNKTDLGVRAEFKLPESFCTIPVSILTGHNFEQVRDRFKEKIIQMYSINRKRDFYLTSPRHYAIVSEMSKVISELFGGQVSCDRLLFTANEITSLYDTLTGKRVSPDEIHKIFDKFCIGK